MQRKGECAKVDTYLIVAAIDFGTAYSGYAFSTRDDFLKDPLKVSSNVWRSGTGTLMSLKTATCALFDPQKKFHSFGFAAEDKYSQLADDDEHNNWYFFKHFKMKLFDKMKLKRKFLLEDQLGRKMAAIEVFSACIAYLKKHLMDTCRNQIPDVSDSDIRWVLTVPAIWNDASKQFMREAATMAGIMDDDLLIALEPEAASICCRHLPLNSFQGTSKGFVPFAPRSKYMVFDAGGGTIDITVHEVQPSGSLKELYKASGGSWGGTYVDKAFRDLLADIVGNEIMDDFCSTNTSDYIDLFREFEVKKRNFKNDMEEKITFKVPIALHENFKAAKGKDIKTHLETKSQYNGKVTWIGDKLRMEATIAKGLFKDACESICSHLTNLFREGHVRDVDTILMVGGFSESPMLQEMIKGFVKGKGQRVIIPTEPGLAVLKGAVIFGHDPSVIEERRCRYTYGVKTAKLFKDGVNLESKKFTSDDGRIFCDDMFDKHVEIGQAVVFGESQITRSYVPTSNDQTQIKFMFYASVETTPMYVTEPSCTNIGELKVDINGTGLDRPVSVKMIFSGTELAVEAVEKSTGNNTKATINFLG